MAIASVSEADSAGLRRITAVDKKLIFASCLGTIFEWYDFYLYVSLTGIIGAQFFGQFDEATADLFVLIAFAAGFLVRPLGGLVFGRLGDLVGRKYTFLLTILIMGFSTFVIGLVPGYGVIGAAAPVLLIVTRLLQGLAIGGEYGGAAIFVAEHAPQRRRGLFTSFIQATATLGLMSSLIVILLTKAILGEANFINFGWRIPFLLSVGLLGVSLWIRLQLNESPAFAKIKADGTASRAPLKDAFGNWANGRIVLLALFGLTMGQGVIWYTGQFYALSFLRQTLRIDNFTASVLLVWAMALAAGFFVFFGWLSDRIGRKPIIMFGCLIAAATYMPIFDRITAIANPALNTAYQKVSVKVIADPADCGNLFNPVDTRKAATSCDIARDLLASHSVKYAREAAPAGTQAQIVIGSEGIDVFAAEDVADPQAARVELDQKLVGALEQAGYPRTDDTTRVRMSNAFDVFRPQVAMLIGLLFLLVLYVAMVYGPIAAALVELFPTRIRYTSLSLPYHIGNGWFGGLLPATAFAMVAETGDRLYGLWYPMAIALACFAIGVAFVPETKDRDITAGD
ncbi:major facilitator superfamily MFS_1 [Methylocella silvestris BL2]|uniref:Major facilitator superfamily MFS_1 n=1 Tax=Methylocella silvestris (strain DSM 15510 / CIP 108128 / LMG 27833 / NCIMB 13906 / BL2) TaxID=395965 RepID=B8ER84_METSB|nr:MFS transporter [Methylocella silvestris]ACK50268.1 major facilitator superfamily MFS_1 [Methylocella silvestris BL2]